MFFVHLRLVNEGPTTIMTMSLSGWPPPAKLHLSDPIFGTKLSGFVITRRVRKITDPKKVGSFFGGFMTSFGCFLISRALFQRFCESMVDILIPTAQHITEVLSCHGHIGKRPGENVGFNRDHVPSLGGSMQMSGIVW